MRTTHSKTSQDNVEAVHLSKFRVQVIQQCQSLIFGKLHDGRAADVVQIPYWREATPIGAGGN